MTGDPDLAAIRALTNLKPAYAMQVVALPAPCLLWTISSPPNCTPIQVRINIRDVCQREAGYLLWITLASVSASTSTLGSDWL